MERLKILQVLHDEEAEAGRILSSERVWGVALEVCSISQV